MVKLIPGVAMAAALLSAQPVRAAAIYVALGDSITFGETDLSYVQSFGDRGYVSLFANALTARNGGGAYPHSGTGHLVC